MKGLMKITARETFGMDKEQTALGAYNLLCWSTLMTAAVLD